jgi:hypothetical protein
MREGRSVENGTGGAPPAWPAIPGADTTGKSGQNRRERMSGTVVDTYPAPAAD